MPGIILQGPGPSGKVGWSHRLTGPIGFTGYNPQRPPNGDLLEGWGGISDVWLTLGPVSEAKGGGGGSAEARGVSPLLWAGSRRSW